MISRSRHRLVLGTAQLGMRYGIANDSGLPDLATAQRIVKAAWNNGIRCFDTAQGYGCSENFLGDSLRSEGIADRACVITKLSPALADASSADIVGSIRDSMQRLGIPRLWAVLLHREDQLDQWNGALGWALQQARSEGLTERVGVSIYSVTRALQALECPGLDVLQVPANLFDRRMKRAQVFAKAATVGATVLIRSIYLQGVALFTPAQSQATAPFALPAVAALDRFCRATGLDQKRFAFEYARDISPEALRIVGAETPEQVLENSHLESQSPPESALFRQWDSLWPDDEEILVNPSRWPTSAA